MILAGETGEIKLKKVVFLLLVCMICLAGCGKNRITNIIEGNMRTYYEMSDGTWMCDENSYQYRLEISGRIPTAVKDSTFVYLSNIEDISFKRAYMAAGLSSNMDDYFSPDEAVLVEMR